MSDKLQITIAIVAGAVVVATIVAIAIISNQQEPARADAIETTSESEDRTPDWESLQASYLEGCMGSGGQNESSCLCMYDGLVKDKGLSLTDMEMMANGQFTDEQMSAIASCM